MATPGELSSTIARLLGVSEPTVRVHDHNLAGAGLRTAGGRGRSAAKMTPRDAAALLITVHASPTLREGIETYKAYSSLVAQRGRLGDSPTSTSAWDLRFMPVPAITSLAPEHTLIDFLTAMIEAAVSGDLRIAAHHDRDIRSQFVDSPGEVARVQVKLHWPFAAAEVSIAVGDYKETHVYFPKPKRGKLGFKLPNTDTNIEKTFSDRTIYAVAKLLKGD